MGLRLLNRKVTVNHTLGCGHCEFCMAGETVLCAENLGIAASGSGGDAQYVVLPERACFALAEGLSFGDGAFIACTGATAYAALRKISPSGRDSLAVFGLGPVGLSGVLVGKALGARVIGVDPVPQRRELALAVGADEVVRADELDAATAIHDLTNGRGASCSFETSGAPRGQSDAVACLGNKGRAVFVGVNPTGAKAIAPEQIIHREITLYGSKVLPSPLVAELMRFMLAHELHFDSLVTNRVSLEQSPQALADFDSGTAGKFAIEM